MLLGLAVTAWNIIVWLTPILEVHRTLPFWNLFATLIGDQIRALCLMVAVVIADRAVDEGAPRRRTYVLAAFVGCIAGFVASQPFDWVWRNYVMGNRWATVGWPWAHGASGNLFWPIFW